MAAPLAAIVLAAGKGTRMKGARPKVLHEIAGRPLIDFPVKLAVELGADPVAVVLGHGLTEVEAVLGARFGSHPRLRIVPQTEQRGTAHAVLSARKRLAGFTGPLLILYGDVPLLTTDTLRRLLSVKTGPLSFLTTRPPDPHGYGRVVRTSDGLVERVVEQRDCNPAEEEIKRGQRGHLSRGFKVPLEVTRPHRHRERPGELYLTDLVALAAAAGGATAVLADFEEVSRHQRSP